MFANNYVVHNILCLLSFQTLFDQFKCLLFIAILIPNMHDEISTEREIFTLYWIC